MNTNTEWKCYVLPYNQIKMILDNKELNTSEDIDNFIKNIQDNSNEDN